LLLLFILELGGHRAVKVVGVVVLVCGSLRDLVSNRRCSLTKCKKRTWLAFNNFPDSRKRLRLIEIQTHSDVLTILINLLMSVISSNFLLCFVFSLQTLNYLGVILRSHETIDSLVTNRLRAHESPLTWI
jgi:hypothetical protein